MHPLTRRARARARQIWQRAPETSGRDDVARRASPGPLSRSEVDRSLLRSLR